MTAEETAALVELARDRLVLELGAQYGHSTLAMAAVARQVWSVDWHRGDDQAGRRETLEAYWANVRDSALEDKVIPVVGRFAEVLPLLRLASFGLIFHDGYHELKAMISDLTLARPLLEWSGALAVHDWTLFDVTPACLGLFGPPHRTAGRLAIWQSIPGRSHI